MIIFLFLLHQEMDKDTNEITSDPFETSDTSEPKNESDVSDSDELDNTDYHELEIYFPHPGEFEELSSYEKKLFLSQKRKYEYFREMHNAGDSPLPIQPPFFMRKHFMIQDQKAPAASRKRAAPAVENSNGPPSKIGAAAPIRQSFRIKHQRAAVETAVLAGASNNMLQEEVLSTEATTEEEEFTSIKHYFTPSEWSKMSYFAKRHAQAAADSYNSLNSQGLTPPLPKFMAASRTASSTVVRSDSSTLPVLGISESHFEFSSGPNVSHRPVPPARREPLRDITQNNFEQVTPNTSAAAQHNLVLNENNDCTISKKICGLVKKILPTIDEEVLKKLVINLVDVNGVESVEDLTLVELDWLTTAGLKQIQAKKVLQVFSKQDAKENNICVTQEQAKKKRLGQNRKMS
ncbi:Histone-lysine N-methyltransferase PRDM9 [Frankliniella fusca]|uniref:Histone-lysine N-methyltransferase PRDM9 n=1 Tax=Frankliniella fusca TaxID=407009 RepID=A0AAE1HY41_9NEOP|nr:Histone-lysine N-methyltransferase PRDM9 [Frankliniella fusca]